ncbi:Hypothetical protein NTJ_03855 [Nesidiocoris tenuis]|uniref:SUEL-type lectin domain-containing protein n=1 Tax=Nesidiocoris tenuis TaxID=355587 RepID=A0ABN7AFJ1_9HEMI|nr:Hypothetical protein NTJ_03855 [Nesidiocoris tenuis]
MLATQIVIISLSKLCRYKPLVACSLCVRLGETMGSGYEQFNAEGCSNVVVEVDKIKAVSVILPSLTSRCPRPSDTYLYNTTVTTSIC